MLDAAGHRGHLGSRARRRPCTRRLRLVQTNPDWFEGDERDAIRQLRTFYQDYKHAASRPDHAALVSDRLVERYAIAGDAVEVSERLSTLMAHPRLHRIVLTPQGGYSGAR